MIYAIHLNVKIKITDLSQFITPVNHFNVNNRIFSS